MDKLEAVWNMIQLVSLSAGEAQKLIPRLERIVNGDPDISVFQEIMAKLKYADIAQVQCVPMVRVYMDQFSVGITTAKDWWDCTAHKLGYSSPFQREQHFIERMAALKAKYPERF